MNIKDCKVRKIVVGMIMGMNCLNGFMAINQTDCLKNIHLKQNGDKNGGKVMADADSYTATCNKVLNVLDRALCGRAEAAAAVNPKEVVSGDSYASATHSAANVGSEISCLAGLTLADWQTGDAILYHRMHNLRQGQQSHGLWAEINKTDSTLKNVGEGGNSYTIGYDMKAKGPWSYGVALNYEKGNNNYNTGNGSYRSYSLGAYGSWQGKHGNFVDITARRGNLEHNFDLGTVAYIFRAKRDIHQDAMAFAVKYGHHLDLGHESYLEPYGKLGYVHVAAADYTASYGISVKQGEGKSLYGKLGIVYGKHFGKNGFFYADMSMNRELSGDVDTVLEKNHFGAITLEHEIRGSWMDVNLGYQQSFAKNAVWYCTVGKSAVGGSVGGEWTYGLGLNYHF